MRCAPAFKILVADNLAQLLVLLGIVLLQFFIVNLAEDRHLERGIAGTHTGTRATGTGTGTVRAHSSRSSAGESISSAREGPAVISRQVCGELRALLDLPRITAFVKYDS